MELSRLSVKNKLAAMGLAGMLALTGCASRPGHHPETIDECTPAERKGPPAIVDSRGANDPAEVLKFAEQPERHYKDESNHSSLGNNGDSVDGLGELVCKVTAPGGSISLVFLPENIIIRDDFIAERQKEHDSVENILQQVRQQTTTSLSPR